MIAVIFEAWPADRRREEYLDIASQLKTALVDVDGFISIERFQSLSEPEKLLSLSFWRDEEAVSAWRNLDDHRAAQLKGRRYIFADYRVRVASVIRDYGRSGRQEAPCDGEAVDKRLD